MATIIVSMYARFLAEPVAQGGTALVTMLVSAVFMVLLWLAIKKFNKIKWLSDFAMSISMIAGMASAVLFSM